jgi:hypothetical protein
MENGWGNFCECEVAGTLALFFAIFPAAVQFPVGFFPLDWGWEMMSLVNPFNV